MFTSTTPSPSLAFKSVKYLLGGVAVVNYRHFLYFKIIFLLDHNHSVDESLKVVIMNMVLAGYDMIVRERSLLRTSATDIIVLIS